LPTGDKPKNNQNGKKWTILLSYPIYLSIKMAKLMIAPLKTILQCTIALGLNFFNSKDCGEISTSSFQWRCQLFVAHKKFITFYK